MKEADEENDVRFAIAADRHAEKYQVSRFLHTALDYQLVADKGASVSVYTPHKPSDESALLPRPVH